MKHILASALAPLLFAAGPLWALPGQDPFPVSAVLAAPGSELGDLEVGGHYELEVSVELAGEINVEFPWSSAFRSEGERRPLLLIDSPDCIRLEGAAPDVLVTPDDYQSSYLHFPHGRRMLSKTVSVAFELVAEPAPEDTIGINVVGYLGQVGTDSRQDSSFVRRRLELPLTAGARVASDGSTAQRSSWGEDRTLQIGDRFPEAALVDNTGAPVQLSEWLGKRDVLVTLYRRET